MTTAAMVTSSRPQNAISILNWTSKSLPVSSSGNYVSGHKEPSQTSPLSGYTIGQTAPIYTSAMTAWRSEIAAFEFEEILTLGCIANPLETPPQMQILN